MSSKSERLNLRCSEETLMTLREAAQIQDQALTSFILGSALDRARAVLAEDRVLRLSPTRYSSWIRRWTPPLRASLLWRACSAAFDRRSVSRREDCHSPLIERVFAES